MPPLPQTIVCPVCQKALRIPEKLAGRSVKCRQCGTSLSPQKTNSPATGPRPLPLPAEAPEKTPEPLPLPEDEAPIARLLSRRRSSAYSKLNRAAPWLLAFIFISAMAGLVIFFKEGLFGSDSRFAQSSPDAVSGPSQPAATKLADALRSVPTRPGAEASKPAAKSAPVASQPRRPEPRPVRNAGKIPWPYPARALLIGIKNYLYLSPLNPGAAINRSSADDPLGLQALQRVLTEDLSLRRDQVLALSDVAETNPQPPTRATIMATLKECARTCRPGDRLIVFFMGHAAWVEEKAFLVPIEGRLDQPATLIALSDFWMEIKQSLASQKLVIFDVGHLDPEQGHWRAAPGPLAEPLAQAFCQPPNGVQVWVTCGAGQQSYQFVSSGFRGSTFTHLLARLSRLTDPVNWKRIENDPQLKAGELPLLVLAPHVNAEVNKFVRQRWQAEQSPRLVGASPTAVPAAGDSPPPPLRLVVPPAGEKVVDAAFIQAVLRELDLSSDPARRLDLASLPPLSARAHAAYASDLPANWKTLAELRQQVQARPFRAACVDVVTGLQKKELQFRMRFRHNSNETAFKKMLEDSQHLPASAEWELSELLAQLQEAKNQHRDAEQSPRWRAHADYLHARLLGRIIQVREYNFILGNKLRKDSPVLQNKEHHNGWVVIPQERLQQKETRELDHERQQLLDRITAEHPGTIWEVLAQRERLTWLGLTVQEAKVE